MEWKTPVTLVTNGSPRVRHHLFSGVCPRGHTSDQDSLGGVLSSMAMSFNSVASKISPHSMHSTNSASSSRATICTRGCLHASLLVLWGDGGVGIINPGYIS